MIGATDFTRNGSVSIIPANTSNIELISLIQQSELSFSLTNDEISTITEMTLVVTNEEQTDDGSPHFNKKYLFTVTDPEEIETIIEEGANRNGKLLQNY